MDSSGSGGTPSIPGSPGICKTLSHPIDDNDPDTIQAMIDVSADYLESLRTQCATSNSLTQHEIRNLETKLVRMFSDLLIIKARLPERIPSSGLVTSGTELRQWLRVVGLSPESLHVCLTRLNTLEQLLEKTDSELKDLLVINPAYRDDEVRRLTIAMKNLRKCRAALLSASPSSAKEPENLFWDSWDRHNHHHHRGSSGNIGVSASPRSHRTVAKQQSNQSPSKSISSEVAQSPSLVKTPTSDERGHGGSSLLTSTISPSPPNSPFSSVAVSSGMVTTTASSSANDITEGTPSHRSATHHRRVDTPPHKKKHHTLFSNNPPLTPLQTSCGAGGRDAANISSPLMISSTSSSSSQDLITTPIVPMGKSKSHESQFQENCLPQNIGATPSTPTFRTTSSSVNTSNSSSSHPQSNLQQIISRSRIHNDPSPDSFSSANSDMFAENSNNLTVPRSPCTPIVPLGMGHTISHRFTKGFKMMSTCDLCQKQMFIGLKCKECKYRCHKECEPSVPPSCGLPIEFVDEFKKTLRSVDCGFLPPPNSSPNLSTLSRNSGAAYLPTGRRQKSQISGQHPDSSSPGSSCNSSSPSSPALFNQQQHSHGSSGSTAIMSSSGGGSSSTSTSLGASGGAGSTAIATPSSFYKNSSQFNFPDVTITSALYNKVTTQTLYSAQDDAEEPAAVNNETDTPVRSSASFNCNNISGNTTTATTTGNFSDRDRENNPNSVGRSPGDQNRPPLSELFDTHKSNDSDKTVSVSGSTSDSDKTPIRLDSTEDGDSRQNSSLKEWDIPYGDIMLLEIIGKGRFGTVHRAIWHGDVAVKLLKEDYLDDENMLEAFKLEVANFKKTRHENLVLFMGACMNPPYMAIVTSLCKGNTLYTFVHARREKFTIARTTIVAKQITQGMSYLHARGILHRDLRTKNIFVENGKVIITDFGLFSSTNLLYCSARVGIPSGWLCYLAPELIRTLTAYQPTDEVLRFSEPSDVYSFGTVYYELLAGEFPFKEQPPEAIIWQVGRGMKQTLANLQTSREVKDILMLCWSFQADDRPDFPKLLTLIERFPKKQRLIRSPSHPVKLSKSAESVF